MTMYHSEDFAYLLGQTVTILCVNYFYTGRLIGVSEAYVLLGNPSIVYETGSWEVKGWKDAQRLPTDKLYVSRASIEAFGILK